MAEGDVSGMGANILFLVRDTEKDERFMHVETQLPVAVGRDTAQVRCALYGNGVSRFHASIDVRDGILLVRDEASRNGTKVDGELIPPMKWCSFGTADGTQEIRISHYRLRVLPEPCVPLPSTPVRPSRDPYRQQLDLATASVLPIEGPWRALKAMGIVAGEPVADDARFNGFVGFDCDPDTIPGGGPIFRYVTFPKGWCVVPSPNGGLTSSYLLDERGIRRVEIHWEVDMDKREAWCKLCNAGEELAREIIANADLPLALPGEWPRLNAEERRWFMQEATLAAGSHEPSRRTRGRALLTLLANPG